MHSVEGHDASAILRSPGLLRGALGIGKLVEERPCGLAGPDRSGRTTPAHSQRRRSPMSLLSNTKTAQTGTSCKRTLAELAMHRPIALPTTDFD